MDEPPPLSNGLAGRGLAGNDFPELLVVMALEIEAGEVFRKEGVPVLFTGIGKVNAAYTLTKRLTEYRQANRWPRYVINFGTAGSERFSTGALVACSAFIQRDMDVTALGFAPGVTPFEQTPAELRFPVVLNKLPQAVCSTGDSFATCAEPLPCDVREMEAYALAKVCLLEGATFVCAKYITDGADHSAANDWQTNVHKAALEFIQIYRELAAAE